MIKIEITIPQNYNDGQEIEQSRLEFLRNYIIARFGGLTITPNQIGYWLGKHRRLYTDNNETWTIIIPEKLKTGITQLKSMLKDELKQEEIFIIKSEVEIIK